MTCILIYFITYRQSTSNILPIPTPQKTPILADTDALAQVQVQVICEPLQRYTSLRLFSLRRTVAQNGQKGAKHICRWILNLKLSLYR